MRARKVNEHIEAMHRLQQRQMAALMEEMRKQTDEFLHKQAQESYAMRVQEELKRQSDNI